MKVVFKKQQQTLHVLPSVFARPLSKDEVVSVDGNVIHTGKYLIVDVKPIIGRHQYITVKQYQDWTFDLVAKRVNVQYEINEYGLEEAKLMAISEINASFNQIYSGISNEYPEGERLTWDTQRTEVLAWLADNSVSTPIMDTIASSRGIDREVLIGKAAIKIQEYTNLGGTLVGKRQGYEDAILQATSAEEALSVVWTE